MNDEMEITSEMVSNEKVINQLKTRFPELDLEIIESVAYESNYHAEVAANHLMDISRGADSTLSDLIVLDVPVNNDTSVSQKEILHTFFSDAKNRPPPPTTTTVPRRCADGLNSLHLIDGLNRCILEGGLANAPANELSGMGNCGEVSAGSVSNWNGQPIETSAGNVQPVVPSASINYAKALLLKMDSGDVGAEMPLRGNEFDIRDFNTKPKSRAEVNIERVVADVKRGVKVLILMRGLPGSGKSRLACDVLKKSIGTCDPKMFIVSADDYFDRNGAYVYDKAQLQEAHRWTQKRALSMLTQGISPVIVDNTNTQIWEMKPYCLWAVDNSYTIEVLEPLTPWAFNERELARRNVHNVPKATIRHMLDRYERGLTVEDLFEQFNLCYRKKLPPQPRTYPKIPAPIDKLLSVETNLDSWVVLEPTQPRKHVSTMTGEKTAHSKLIAPKNDFVSAPVLPYKLHKDGFHDKGCMTDETAKMTVEIENLCKLFPDIPIEYLQDVYEKCQYDVDYTLDILLKDKMTIIQNYNPPPPKEVPKEVIEESETIEEQQPPKKIKQGTSELATSLKKSLEKSVVLNQEHYTKMTNNKMKQMPGTSKTEGGISDAETLVIGSEEDMDDSSYEAIDLSDDNSDSQEETVELNVGDGFINQLNRTFGDSAFGIPAGIQAVIDVPVSLGRQLFALWLESLFKQMDMQSVLMEQMLKEDEEFAKKLQEQEFMGIAQEETPDLREIMKEQLHLSRQKKVVDEWKNLTPDDMAYKMTIEKLRNNFPEVDRETLVEIFAAHNNRYKDTVESLIHSGLRKENEVDYNEPINLALLMDMKVSHQSSMTETDDTNGKSPNELREEARLYQNKRQELLDKARNYYSKGMYPVALFYSELASKHTHMYEKYNNLAAETFLAEHFSQNNNYRTIDLHYLYVAEALVALDRFLDNNIMLLCNENKKAHEDLHVITGRGKNSRNGKPRIKPAVLKRLQERGIKTETVNRGLIRARIYRNTKMTTSL